MVELVSMTAEPSLSGREILGIAVAYALGCFTTGYYLVQWRTGQDIREVGSGNVGATNAHRALGRWGFVVTFLGDFGKGLLAVSGARLAEFGPLALLLVLLAVVAGHNWPVQLSFGGGKGISTSLGAILVYDPLLTAGLVLVFLGFYAGWRKFTRSGLAAYAFIPLLALISRPGLMEVTGMVLLTGMVLAAHHQNLREEWGQLKPLAKR